jgi:hypothetical protein
MTSKKDYLIKTAFELMCENRLVVDVGVEATYCWDTHTLHKDYPSVTDSTIACIFKYINNKKVMDSITNT